MTSKIVVNNIEADAGVSTVTFASNISAPTFTGNVNATSGVTTFSNGTVLIGSATSTGTASQRLQVLGGALFNTGANTTDGVGIGITNPTARLHISAQLNNSIGGLFIDSKTRTSLETNTPLLQIDSGLAGSNQVGALWFNSSGNLGIGSTIPSQKLDVNGTIRSFSGTNAGTFKDNQLRTDSAGTFYFDHGTVGQSFQFRTSTSSSLDTTGPSITSAGNIAFASGKGIDFSATSNSSGTMTSELLSDYEEGTWTPTVTGGGWNSAVTLNLANYTKIGRSVTVIAYFTVVGTPNTSDFTMSGLPFTCLSNGYSPGVADISPGGKKGCYVRSETSSTSLVFLYSSETTAAVRQALKGNEIGSGGYIIFSLTYFV